MNKLSHYDKSGRVRMVDVTEKRPTARVAEAHAFVRMKSTTVANLRRLKSPKGNPLEIARIAGIGAAKRTLGPDSSLSPPGVDARGCERTKLCQNGVEITSQATATGPTGVEMEALVAVSVAALTIYDMCKALERGMEVTELHLVRANPEAAAVFTSALESVPSDDSDEGCESPYRGRQRAGPRSVAERDLRPIATRTLRAMAPTRCCKS